MAFLYRGLNNTNTIWGDPQYNYGFNNIPQNPLLIIKAPIFGLYSCSGSGEASAQQHCTLTSDECSAARLLLFLDTKPGRGWFWQPHAFCNGLLWWLLETACVRRERHKHAPKPYYGARTWEFPPDS